MYKKNLMKLLPAVAVIIAIAAAGFQQDSEVKSTKTVQAAENELIKSDELTSLLTTAYFNDGGMKDTDEADSSILKTKKSKSKITGIPQTSFSMGLCIKSVIKIVKKQQILSKIIHSRKEGIS